LRMSRWAGRSAHGSCRRPNLTRSAKKTFLQFVFRARHGRKIAENIRFSYSCFSVNWRYWRAIFLVSAFCILNSAFSAASPLPIQWFYTEGCRKCAEVKLILDRIERVHGGKVGVERLDITKPENYMRMMDMERRCGVNESFPMEIFVGGQCVAGHDLILRDLEKTVSAVLAAPAHSSCAAPAIENRKSQIENSGFSRLHPGLVASAGLIDGINPCAFATIVFLVSLLLGRHFTRPQIVRAGLFFVAAVFISYFLIGLGAFRLVYRLNAFPFVAAVVFWGIAGAAVGLGILSLKDAFVYHRTGQAAAIGLGMPGPLRTRLHSVLRARIRPVHVGAACFTAGMAVSVLELVCTGQIYFPTLMMLSGDPLTRWKAFGYLALYNAMFVLPLLIVLALCLGGVKLGTFVQWSRKSVVAVKLAAAVLFFGLGAAMIAPRILEK